MTVGTTEFPMTFRLDRPIRYLIRGLWLPLPRRQIENPPTDKLRGGAETRPPEPAATREMTFATTCETSRVNNTFKMGATDAATFTGLRSPTGPILGRR